MNEVHHLKVGVGVLGFTLGVHRFLFIVHLATLPPCRVVLQHDMYLKLWHLFNIEHYDVKLKSINIQGERRIDIQAKNMTDKESWWVVQTKPQHEVQAMTHLEQQGITTYCPKFQQKN
jgi:hypothetical protein